MDNSVSQEITNILLQQSSAKPNEAIVVEIQENPRTSEPLILSQNEGMATIAANGHHAKRLAVDKELLKIHNWLFYHVPPAESLEDITNAMVRSQWSADELKLLVKTIADKAAHLKLWSDLSPLDMGSEDLSKSRISAHLVNIYRYRNIAELQLTNLSTGGSRGTSGQNSPGSELRNTPGGYITEARMRELLVEFKHSLVDELSVTLREQAKTVIQLQLDSLSKRQLRDTQQLNPSPPMPNMETFDLQASRSYSKRPREEPLQSKMVAEKSMPAPTNTLPLSMSAIDNNAQSQLLSKLTAMIGAARNYQGAGPQTNLSQAAQQLLLQRQMLQNSGQPLLIGELEPPDRRLKPDLGNLPTKHVSPPGLDRPKSASGSDTPSTPNAREHQVASSNATISASLLNQISQSLKCKEETAMYALNDSASNVLSSVAPSIVTPPKTNLTTFAAIAEDSSISLTSLRGPVHTQNIHGHAVVVERITDRKGRVGFFLLGEQVVAIKARSKHNTAALFIKPIVKLDFGDGYTYDPTWRENATKMTRKKLNGQVEHPYERSGEKSWRCSQCNKGCTTRARTNGNDEIINVKYFCHHREHLHNFEAEMRYNCYSQDLFNGSAGAIAPSKPRTTLASAPSVEAQTQALAMALDQVANGKGIGGLQSAAGNRTASSQNGEGPSGAGAPAGNAVPATLNFPFNLQNIMNQANLAQATARANGAGRVEVKNETLDNSISNVFSSIYQ